MKIEFHTKKYELQDSFKDFMTGRLAKFEKYLDDDVEVRINLEEQKSNQTLEVLIMAHGDVIRAHADSPDMREAFMDAFHKIDVQLEKKKKKLKDRKRREAHKLESEWQMSVINRSGALVPETDQKMVTTSRLEVKTLSVEEAINLMEKTGEDFILFRDSDRGGVKLVQRRQDGNYTLLIPE